jgi:hypothetical protein
VALAVSALAAAGLSAAAGASGSVASASGKRTLLISNCQKAKFKPQTVILACGDAGFIASQLTWSSWTRKRASGSGTGDLKICQPSCAEGPTVSGPLELDLSKPTKCRNGKRVFSRVHYVWTSGAPASGVPPSGAIPLGCKLLAI